MGKIYFLTFPCLFNNNNNIDSRCFIELFNLNTTNKLIQFNRFRINGTV